MTSALLVPLNLDVLRLPRSASAAGPLMDLEGLPWTSPAWGRDVNADTPFMASAVISRPFSGTQRVLEAGFHLHWALPDALCRGAVDPQTGKVSFPAVPNRWLVTRVLDGAVTRWVVESDYIWPKISEWPEDGGFPRYYRGLAVTLLAHDMRGSEQPYQHLGRAFSWAEWRETSRACRMAQGKLTAVGHGDVTFAAYHPHCHSVFGFSDPWESAGEVPEQIEYRVVGWYSDTAQDPLEGASWESDGADSPTWTLASHLWKVSARRAPRRTLCFASARVIADRREGAGPCVAVMANTATEAMSAYLAAELSDDAVVRAKIEDQLEAIQMRAALSSRDLDLAPRLRAARHERGFRPERGVPRWKITVTGEEREAPADLSAALGEGARALNALEADLHRRTVEHRAAQQALYADWSRYMSAAYHAPDEQPHIEIDVIKDYIERAHLRADRGGAAPVITEKAAEIARIKGEIEATLRDLRARVEAFRLSLVARGALGPADPPPLAIEQAPGPRFWRPNDPVLLMTGGGVRVTERHGQDGRGQPDGHLACGVHELSFDPWSDKKPDFTEVADRLAVPAQVDTSRCTGFSESSGEPYNPIFIEWSVDLYPVEVNTRQRFSGRGGYDPGVIVDNYDIPPRASDLSPRTGVDIVADPDRYDGRCFLSPHASDTVLARICAVITEQILDGYGPLRDERNTKPYRARLEAWHGQARGSAFYVADASRPGKHRFEPAERAALEEWYLTRPLGPDGLTTLADLSDKERFDDPMWTAIRALDELHEPSGERRAFLSASLDGFNDNLLGFEKHPVLPIDEPIGFEHYRRFSQTVGELTGQRVATPEPESPYSPIRSGELEVSALRLVDSFGQLLDVEPTRVLGPVRYTSMGRQGAIYFPPRVVQAMHAKFRWLEAERRHEELLEIPGSEVICGWLVPSPGDHSITVFSRSGAGLGLLTIDRDEDYVEWVPAPGQPAFAGESAVSSRERDVMQMDAAIDNAHLRKVIQHLWSAPTAYFTAFVDTLADAQENIDPEASSQYSSLAMLLGRPLAVARAELDIFPLEETVARGDWIDFERRVRGERPSDDGLSRVRFPMRLGDYRQLNDGLAGYWIEHPDGSFADRCFHAQAADDVAGLGSGKFNEGYKIEAHVRAPEQGASLQRFEGQTINIRQTIADAPLSLTLLFDPRGVVHLTTGILPTKVIDVPTSYFAEALQSIELWLKAGPLLARQGKHDLPLPSDPEYDVVWREPSWSKTAEGEDGALTWDDQRVSPTIRSEQVVLGIKELKLATDMETLVKQRWLAKVDPNGIRYRLLPKEKRGELGLGEVAEAALGAYLDQRATQIGEILTAARFEDRFEAREGWLVFQRLQR